MLHRAPLNCQYWLTRHWDNFPEVLRSSWLIHQRHMNFVWSNTLSLCIYSIPSYNINLSNFYSIFLGSEWVTWWPSVAIDLNKSLLVIICQLQNIIGDWDTTVIYSVQIKPKNDLLWWEANYFSRIRFRRYICCNEGNWRTKTWPIN